MTRGLKTVLANLNKEVRKIQGDTLIGVRKAALFIEGESNEIVPQRLGPLINSSFSDAERQGNRSVGRVGYTVKYAPFVHEMPTSFNFTKPGTGPKFLQKPIAQNHDMILNIIQKATKIDD